MLNIMIAPQVPRVNFSSYVPIHIHSTVFNRTILNLHKANYWFHSFYCHNKLILIKAGQRYHLSIKIQGSRRKVNNSLLVSMRAWLVISRLNLITQTSVNFAIKEKSKVWPWEETSLCVICCLSRCYQSLETFIFLASLLS